MKTQDSAFVCITAVAMALSTVTIAPVSARQMHANIDYQRYLEEKDNIQSDVDAWKAAFGDIAKANGLMPVSEERSIEDQDEDLRQRIFMTEQGIKKVQVANPDANFSIMSPFSAMTDEEFGSFAFNSYVQGNDTIAVDRNRRLRGEADFDWANDLFNGNDTTTSLIDSISSIVGKLIGGLTEDTGDNAAVLAGGSQASYQFSDLWDWRPRQQPTPTPTTATPATTQPATTSTPSSTEAAVADQAGSVDWSTTTCMAPVQSQGQCGSCWAFATVSAVESAQCIAGGKKSLTKYSEQQLVSCDSKDWGCNGGAPVYAFDYIQQAGLCTADDFPYTAGRGYSASCSSSCQPSDTGMTGYSQLSGEDELLSALNEHPVVVAVASGNMAWKQYTGGVLSTCDTTQLDHAVVAVGYDSSSLKIRNSWGSYWGEDGYIRLKRSSSRSGTCGVLTDMSHPEM